MFAVHRGLFYGGHLPCLYRWQVARRKYQKRPCYRKRRCDLPTYENGACMTLEARIVFDSVTMLRGHGISRAREGRFGQPLLLPFI